MDAVLEQLMAIVDAVVAYVSTIDFASIIETVKEFFAGFGA